MYECSYGLGDDISSSGMLVYNLNVSTFESDPTFFYTKPTYFFGSLYNFGIGIQ